MSAKIVLWKGEIAALRICHFLLEDSEVAENKLVFINETEKIQVTTNDTHAIELPAKLNHQLLSTVY